MYAVQELETIEEQRYREDKQRARRLAALAGEGAPDMTTEATDDMLAALAYYDYWDYRAEWRRLYGAVEEAERVVHINGQTRRVHIYRLTSEAFYSHVAELIGLLHQYARAAANGQTATAMEAWRLTAVYEHALLL